MGSRWPPDLPRFLGRLRGRALPAVLPEIASQVDRRESEGGTGVSQDLLNCPLWKSCTGSTRSKGLGGRGEGSLPTSSWLATATTSASPGWSRSAASQAYACVRSHANN